VEGSVALIARRNGYDVRTINEIWIGHVYDRWYRLTGLPSPATVLDIGANCGYFTVLASRLGAAHIVSVEPDPGNLRLLRSNVALNALNVEIIPVAIVADTETTIVQLHLSEDPRLHSVLSRLEASAAGIAPRAIETEVISVPAMDLTRLIRQRFPSGERLDLLKVDIEGVEWDVLESLEDAEFTRIRCVVVESDLPMPIALRRRLPTLGFDIYNDSAFWAAISRA
jgi:FkbM family methyltransferase